MKPPPLATFLETNMHVITVFIRGRNIDGNIDGNIHCSEKFSENSSEQQHQDQHSSAGEQRSSAGEQRSSSLRVRVLIPDSSPGLLSSSQSSWTPPDPRTLDLQSGSSSSTESRHHNAVSRLKSAEASTEAAERRTPLKKDEERLFIRMKEEDDTTVRRRRMVQVQQLNLRLQFLQRTPEATAPELPVRTRSH
ncbi:uncharacterized protein V6R79_004643 [Siganus canaliculatus]